MKNMIKVKLFIIISFFVSTFFQPESFAYDKVKKTAHKNEMFVGSDSSAGKVVRQFHQALKTGDTRLARSLLAENLVVFEGGSVERSADEYANNHMLADMKYLTGINNELLEHKVEISGNVAYSMSRSKSTGSYTDRTIDVTGMETIVLNKLNGQWKIVHIHWSN